MNTIYETLESHIESYLENYGFEMDGDQYKDCLTHDFELPDGLTAECVLVITGYNHHENGTYDTPPSDTGEINIEVRRLAIYDEEGEELECINDAFTITKKY